MTRSSIVEPTVMASHPRPLLGGVLVGVAWAFCLLIGDGPRTVLDWAWLVGLGTPLLIVAGFAGLALRGRRRAGFTREAVPADETRRGYDRRCLY